MGADNRAAEFPDHLVHFRAQNYSVDFGHPFVEGSEGQVHLAGESGFYMPGSHEIVRVIFKNNILTDFFQPPVNQQAVFGGTGPSVQPPPRLTPTVSPPILAENDDQFQKERYFQILRSKSRQAKSRCESMT